MLPFRYLDVAIQIIFSLVTASAANMSACLASGSTVTVTISLTPFDRKRPHFQMRSWRCRNENEL